MEYESIYKSETGTLTSSFHDGAKSHGMEPIQDIVLEPGMEVMREKEYLRGSLTLLRLHEQLESPDWQRDRRSQHS